MSVYGLNVNSGSFFGNGYGSVGSTGRRVANSTTINRISRDLAAGYRNDLEIVDEYIKKGEIDKALKLYDEVLEDARETASAYGYELSDGQISSSLTSSYQNITGLSLKDSINKNTSGSFVQGLKEGVPIIGWFFAKDTTQDEALAKLSGNTTSFKDKAKEVIGGTISGAATGAAVGLLPFGPLGVVSGAIIGGVSGALSVIVKDSI